MKLKNVTVIGLLILILLLSAAIGHFLPPAGLLASPIVMPLLTGIVFTSYSDFNIFFKSILTYLFIGLNDIGIKLFAGGIHDAEGVGWIEMLFFVGLVPSFIILLIS